jgi:hypothetical protein
MLVFGLPSRRLPSFQRGAGRLGLLGRFNFTGNSNHVCSLGVGIARGGLMVPCRALWTQDQSILCCTVSTVHSIRCPARCARAACSAGAERATVWRKRPTELSLGEWVPLSCHKQKDSGSRADTSTQARSPPAQGRLHRGSQLQQPATQSSGATGGPRPMSHVKLSASTPMGRLVLHLRWQAVMVI